MYCYPVDDSFINLMIGPHHTSLLPLIDTQLSMLSDIFPRHVIEFISFNGLGGGVAAASGEDPGVTAAAVPEQMGQLARHHQDVTIMFMDIVGECSCSLSRMIWSPDLSFPPGFTTMSKLVEPKQVMTFLNQLFTKFDKLVDVFGVQKVETAGEE